MRRDPDEPAAACSRGEEEGGGGDETRLPAAACTANIQGSTYGRAASSSGSRANSADAHGCSGGVQADGRGRGSARVRLCATQETSHKDLQYISLRERARERENNKQ